MCYAEPALQDGEMFPQAGIGPRPLAGGGTAAGVDLGLQAEMKTSVDVSKTIRAFQYVLECSYSLKSCIES